MWSALQAFAFFVASADPTASIAPASATVPAALRFAVHDIEPNNVEPVLARVTTDALVAELRKLTGVQVVAMDEIRAMLNQEAQKQLAGCSDDSCLAEVAEALGVDGIIIGTLAQVGDEIVFGVKRINQREAQTVDQFTQRLAQGDGEACLAAVGPAVEQLFPDMPLRPGAVRGVAPELAMRLNPPPLPRWVFVTTAGAAGGAVLGASAAFLVNGLAYSNAATAAEGSVGGKAVEGAELTGTVSVVRATFWTGVGVSALAVGLGATAGVVALFTDWDDLRGQRELAE